LQIIEDEGKKFSSLAPTVVANIPLGGIFVNHCVQIEKNNKLFLKG
jgi:hypothetical protein